MNRRSSHFNSRGPERGIALVITLVMLAVVTVMAIVFLALARRERSSVKVLEDSDVAHSMAEAALERAKAQAIAEMNLNGSKLHYDLFNSTNFLRPYFEESQGPNTLPDPQNVSYVDKRGNLLGGASYLRMLANLENDARPPVWTETNRSGAGEFRAYLDFNRNRLYEPSGVLPVLDDKGNSIRDAKKNVYFDRFVGDPEWIGVLERPDLPHSETNRFIGRLAYFVLPAGKTLDLNFIHNQADPAANDQIDQNIAQPSGFMRNQGVGPWEINLAAFFRELNTNNYGWHFRSYNYRPNGKLSTGESFDDARAVLAFRYLGRRSRLPTADDMMGPLNPENIATGNVFPLDFVDEYADGPVPSRGAQIFYGRGLALADNDNSKRPWPGSINTNAFSDIQQLFSLGAYSSGLTNRLQRISTNRSSYDRYTFYRLAAQLGADSAPALKGKLHLNFENPVGEITNTIVPWTNALRFFTNAADLMFKASIDGVTNILVDTPFRRRGTYYIIGDTLVRTNFAVTNIQVFAPVTNFPFSNQSEYTPAIHRILQVAANIYDNMNNKGAQYPYYPTVFRPLFTKTATNLYISGFTEVTNANTEGLFNRPTQSLEDAFYGTRSFSNLALNVFGQHLVIGAKKGHPNLNELSLQNDVDIARKLELVKPSAGLPPNQTNQMFIVTMNQRWGIEGWHPYTNAYPRKLEMASQITSRVAIHDGTNFFTVPPVAMFVYTNQGARITSNTWAGVKWIPGPTNFAVVMDQSRVLLNAAAYTNYPSRGFGSTNTARFVPLEPAPSFTIFTTNNVWFYIRDGNRIIDYVSFDNLVTMMDLRTNLQAGRTSVNSMVAGGTGRGGASSAAPMSRNTIEQSMWDTSVVGTSGNITVIAGVTNQIAASAGEFDDRGLDDSVWRAFQHNDPDKRGAISKFRRFMGLQLRSTDEPVPPAETNRMQTPFVPSRLIHQLVKWQANDPFVHFMPQDLTHAPTAGESDISQTLVFRPQPEPWNIGALNANYRPWSGNPLKQGQQNIQADPFAYNVAVKDPGIRKADDWEFPINDIDGTRRTNYFFPSIGALGQVHRGTPWQTIYLKSVYAFTNFTNLQATLMINPNSWRSWAGSIGTFPYQDWKLLDAFTTAPSESATRSLLSVNQTNSAAWSAVLSGVVVATNTTKRAELLRMGDHEGADPTNSFVATVIEPASAAISNIVRSINFARTNQIQMIPQRTLALVRTQPWELVTRTNPVSRKPAVYFDHVGDVLSAPLLSVQSPYLNGDVFGVKDAVQMMHAWTDRAIEYIPQQILSLLQKDEPRFVVYSFGQSLRPAPHSLTSDPNYFHMCTNYQITGEVVTKTTFRVEGEIPNPENPLSLNNPLHAVVESYQVLPPSE